MRELQEKSLRDQYLESLFPKEDESQLLARKYAMDLGLAPISLSPQEGQLLKFFITLAGPKKVLEIGTLTGLSALYMAKGLLPDGKIWTLEKSPEHAECARKVFQHANLNQNQIEVVLGDARETLSSLTSVGPFDFVFIDGNKAAYLDYLNWALKNTKSGAWIVADNVFLSGAVWGQETRQKFNSKQIKTLQEFNQHLADTTQFESVCLPTAEGLFVARRK